MAQRPSQRQAQETYGADWSEAPGCTPMSRGELDSRPRIVTEQVPPIQLAEIILEALRKVDGKLGVLAPSGSYGAYHDDQEHQRCHAGDPQYAACRSVLPCVGI